MAGFPCIRAVLTVVIVELLFKEIEGSVIKRQSDYAMYDYNFNRVGDTDLDNEVTDCGLVKYQYRKGYIRLREYIERIRGCGREGKLKNIEGIARSTMDGIREDEIKGIAAAAMEDIDINSNTNDLSHGQDWTTNAAVKSSSSSIKPPINTVSRGRFRLTSQPQQVQVQNPSYKAAPVVSVPDKSALHNTFANLPQVNKPPTNIKAVTTYNVPQMNNYNTVNETPQMRKFYSNNRPGQRIAPEGKFYYNTKNSPSRYAVQVGQPLHKPAALHNLMNSFHPPQLGREPQRYFTQNNIHWRPPVTMQHPAPTQFHQNNFGSKYQTTIMANTNNLTPFLEMDSQKKVEPESTDFRNDTNKQNLSKNLASLDSLSVVDDKFKPTNKKQSSSSQNASSVKTISGITTAMNNNSPSLARNSKNFEEFKNSHNSKNLDDSKYSEDSKNMNDSKSESLDVPVNSNAPSAVDQLDPVESNPDKTENEQGMNEKHTSPENLEINLDALKQKIMHSTNATFLRRMLKLIRKITHHKDFNKLDSTGQNIVMKADRTIHALNTAYQQAQRDYLETSPPRDSPPMPPAINTDVMDDDVVTKKFQIERKPYQHQQRPFYNNPYYNLQRWQYGLYNGNTLD